MPWSTGRQLGRVYQDNAPLARFKPPSFIMVAIDHLYSRQVMVAREDDGLFGHSAGDLMLHDWR